jgi:hypothetical protein
MPRLFVFAVPARRAFASARTATWTVRLHPAVKTDSSSACSFFVLPPSTGAFSAAITRTSTGRSSDPARSLDEQQVPLDVDLVHAQASCVTRCRHPTGKLHPLNTRDGYAEAPISPARGCCASRAPRGPLGEVVRLIVP